MIFTTRSDANTKRKYGMSATIISCQTSNIGDVSTSNTPEKSGKSSDDEYFRIMLTVYRKEIYILLCFVYMGGQL
jgi:hypothetical protein